MLTLYHLVQTEKLLHREAGSDKTIKFWDVPEGKLLKTLTGHSFFIKSIAFSPDGKILASGSWDKTIKLWSVPEGKLLKTLKENFDINSISFSKDGKILASGSNGSIRLWTMPDCKECYLLFDPSLTKKTKVKKIKQLGVDTKTLPCDTPLPSGATCICDCIASSHTYSGTETVCTCNTVTISTGTQLSNNMTCSCDTVVIGTNQKSSGGGGGSYWYPN